MRYGLKVLIKGVVILGAMLGLGCSSFASAKSPETWLVRRFIDPRNPKGPQIRIGMPSRFSIHGKSRVRENYYSSSHEVIEFALGKTTMSGPLDLFGGSKFEDGKPAQHLVLGPYDVDTHVEKFPVTHSEFASAGYGQMKRQGGDKVHLIFNFVMDSHMSVTECEHVVRKICLDFARDNP